MADASEEIETHRRDSSVFQVASDHFIDWAQGSAHDHDAERDYRDWHILKSFSIILIFYID